MHTRKRSLPSPSLTALERLARLVAAGASPSRAAAVASALVPELQSQGECWGEQLETLQAELDEGISAVEASVADVEHADRPMVLAQLEALRAARQALETERVRARKEGSAATADGRWATYGVADNVAA